MYKSISDITIINKINEIIINSTFFEDLSIWIKKDWLFSNNLIAFPIVKENFFELFENINKNKKYYISGIDIERRKHRELLPIENYQIDYVKNYFLSPNYAYEVINNNFNLDILEPPHYYLLLNDEFNFGFIYDNDTCGDYYVWGKEKYWVEIFGTDFIDKIINNLKNIIIKENENIKHPMIIKTNPKEFDYYVDILKEQGYLINGDE